MTADANLARLAEDVGIFADYVDMQGITRVAGPDTQRALLRAAGVAAETSTEVRDSLALRAAERDTAFVGRDVVIAAERACEVSLARPVRFTVCNETDGAILAEGKGQGVIALPALPMGLHKLCLEDARDRQEVNLIVAPKCAPTVLEQCGQDRIWGGTAALYGLSTREFQNFGTYPDLGQLARGFGHAGADFVGINPVHALGFAAKDTISPYSPSHRGFFNTDHIDLPDLAHAQIPRSAIDYARYRADQHARLRAAFHAFWLDSGAGARAAFDAFCAELGAPLERFARFEVISETYGPDWRRWPAGAEILTVAPEAAAFYKWMQWQADLQLGKARSVALSSGMRLGLYLDLAVGARRGGSESWGDDAPMARGVSLGAPPDHLSPAGQNWQLSAFAPGKLKNCKYANYCHVLRQTMRHAGLLRIDHALGLSRSFWIPDDGSPGGYIGQPFQSLMAIIRIEAVRAGCVIVGEDLGLVPSDFRDEMAASGFYGYSVLQYEKEKVGAFKPVADLRRQSLACFSTHDTPTLAGYWKGRDIEWWQKLGWITQQHANEASAQRGKDKSQLAKSGGFEPEKTGTVVRDRIHAQLASAPSAMVAVQLDDILQVEEAQNVPGTITEHPNWQRQYCKTVAEVAESDDLAATGQIMADADRSNGTRKDTK